MVEQSTPRLSSQQLQSLAPALYDTIEALGDVGPWSGLDEPLLELMRLRASQINGCAFCVQYHIHNATALNVSRDKLNLVIAWREAGIFSAREQAALEWTEALTLVASSRMPDEVYTRALAEFSETELAGLTAAVSAINVWNRLSVAFRFPPDVDD